jgi:hypothetical protein
MKMSPDIRDIAVPNTCFRETAAKTATAINRRLGM